jgi:hypothetical protein
MPVPYRVMISPGASGEGSPEAALTTDARIGGMAAVAVALRVTGTVTVLEPEVNVRTLYWTPGCVGAKSSWRVAGV